MLDGQFSGFLVDLPDLAIGLADLSPAAVEAIPMTTAITAANIFIWSLLLR